MSTNNSNQPFIHLSGLVATPALEPADREVAVQEQIRAALLKLGQVLEGRGADRSHVLTVHIWLRDMALFQSMNLAWNEWADPRRPPSRTCVSGGPVSPGALVELEATALEPGRGGGPEQIERFGLVVGPNRPTICLGVAYRDWFTVCMTAPDLTDSARGQTEQILDQFSRYMDAAGVNREDLVSAQIWSKRWSDASAITAAWNAWVDPLAPPALAWTRADMSRPECLVEIRVSAGRKALVTAEY